MEFRQEQLANGLQVLMETNPSVHSVAMGFFVKTGSRDESSEVAGVSHFLEHMAFKGNDRHTADDVNRIFDEVGARTNASTSEELTIYHGAFLPEYIDRTFDVLAGLIYPSLRQEDFDTEKKVILEEIGMYDDQPFFTAYEKAMETHFNGHPLGRSILGTTASIEALTAQQMRDYHQRRYVAGNITLAVAGNVDFDKVLNLANQYCGDWPAGPVERPTDEACPNGGMQLFPKEQSFQEHFIELAPAPPAADSRRFAAELLSVVLGDYQGSRLYWEFVDTGIAEAVDLSYNEYDGSGTFMTYVSCQPEQSENILERVHVMFDQVNCEGVTEDELQQAKNKLRSRIVLRSERPMGRLDSLGGNWLYRNEYHPVSKDLETCESVSLQDINELLKTYPLGHTTTVGVGPLEKLNLH